MGSSSDGELMRRGVEGMVSSRADKCQRLEGMHTSNKFYKVHVEEHAHVHAYSALGYEILKDCSILHLNYKTRMTVQEMGSSREEKFTRWGVEEMGSSGNGDCCR